jgi:hypothetical protein
MTKDYVIYIGTYGDETLSNGAICSIKKNSIHEAEIVLLNFKDNQINSLADKIIHIDINIKWFGFTAAVFTRDTRPGVYIDDDVRLIDRVSLRDRYSDGLYKPMNGSMVAAWDDITKVGTQPFNPMTNWRMNKLCRLISDEKLANLCAINQCEQIDSIWIHLDKCSGQRTEDRQKLIDYIDNYGGGVVPPSHSVNS